jgi:anti-sigma factor RsiW
MNCESVVERIRALAEGALHGEEKGACMNHVATCQDCADALRGVRAMLVIRDQAAVPGSERVFSRVMSRAGYDPHREASRRGFWLGAGFGGAIAASLLAAAIALGLLSNPVPDAPAAAEFYVSATEVRSMNIAIEADRPLQGAQISILLSGDVEVDGYVDRHELSWVDDLEPGVNRLTLPIRAIGERGGQMVVRLSHPDSEQIFVVQLKVDG